ncbi:MAG: hypothetical protein DDT24_00803 [Chloroflexi bacterium]|nr:hypothetical protein [Chloroflexota bacterium]
MNERGEMKLLSQQHLTVFQEDTDIICQLEGSTDYESEDCCWLTIRFEKTRKKDIGIEHDSHCLRPRTTLTSASISSSDSLSSPS